MTQDATHGLPSDQAAIAEMLGVERTHHRLDRDALCHDTWIYPSIGVVAAGIGVYVAISGGQILVSVLLIVGGLIAILGPRVLVVLEQRGMITAVIIRRDGVALLSRGTLVREIPWGAVTGFEEVREQERGSFWELRTRDGKHARMRNDLADFAELQARLGGSSPGTS